MQLCSLNILERQHVRLKEGPESFSEKIRMLFSAARDAQLCVSRRPKGALNNEPRIRTSAQLSAADIAWLRELGKQGKLRATVDAALEGVPA